ncbi:MAG: hypothetical protein ACRD0L_07535 [Acidimicrobiales bacterium]
MAALDLGDLAARSVLGDLQGAPRLATNGYRDGYRPGLAKMDSTRQIGKQTP